MKITTEISIESFNAWSGAVDTVNTIKDHNKCNEFDSMIEDIYPDGLTDTQLNDILWHDTDWVYNMLSIEED